MAVHNIRERRLFRDLHEKSVLSREIRRLASSMRRWETGLTKKRGKRWQAQYTNAIRRASASLEDLEQQLLSQAQDLKSRVQEELESSVEEVRQFEEQHKKEVQELQASHQELRVAKQALSAAETAQDKADSLSELKNTLRRAERTARKEAKDVTEVEEELASEARDTDILTHELHQLLTEIELLGPEAAENEEPHPPDVNASTA